MSFSGRIFTQTKPHTSKHGSLVLYIKRKQQCFLVQSPSLLGHLLVHPLLPAFHLLLGQLNPASPTRSAHCCPLAQTPHRCRTPLASSSIVARVESVNAVAQSYLLGSWQPYSWSEQTECSWQPHTAPHSG